MMHTPYRTFFSFQIISRFGICANVWCSVQCLAQFVDIFIVCLQVWYLCECVVFGAVFSPVC